MAIFGHYNYNYNNNLRRHGRVVRTLVSHLEGPMQVQSLAAPVPLSKVLPLALGDNEKPINWEYFQSPLTRRKMHLNAESLHADPVRQKMSYKKLFKVSSFLEIYYSQYYKLYIAAIYILSSCLTESLYIRISKVSRMFKNDPNYKLTSFMMLLQQYSTIMLL